ncbi:APC family permease, partial [Staphylococcus aureus]|nr:APC family permease [Staphylococcus aureus]
ILNKFTLAQFGMVNKWIHERTNNWLSKLSLNLLGGIVTFIVFMNLIITKFSQVWPILILLTFVVIFFLKINKQYR